MPGLRQTIEGFTTALDRASKYSTSTASAANAVTGVVESIRERDATGVVEHAGEFLVHSANATIQVTPTVDTGLGIVRTGIRVARLFRASRRH